jgi:Transposase IS200 like
MGCVGIEGIPRRLRLQYPGAIYHLMARVNGRQDIVRDDVDRKRLQEQLGKAAIRCSWRVYAFAIMSNHLHVVLKTPEPNLSRGMQSFLSGLSDLPESPWKEAYHGWILGSGAFIERIRAMVRGDPRRERRRESRLLQSLPLSRVIDVVCASYAIDRSEMSRRGSRHPARAALVHLARSRTMATNTELAGLLGLSRAESVPNLTRRFGAWLATDARLRRQLRSLEEELDQSDHPK